MRRRVGTDLTRNVGHASVRWWNACGVLESGPPNFDEAEEMFCELLRSEGLEQPDEIRRYDDPAEIVFVWNELKRMVVLELEQRDSALGLEPPGSWESPVPLEPPV